MSGHVTDSQRKKLEAALIAALTLLYGASARKALTKLGASTDAPLSAATEQKIVQFAADRASLIQSGVDDRLAGLDDGATPQEVRSGIDQYNADTLIPFFAAWATNQGTYDAYRDSPDPNGSDQSALEATQWVWTRYTDNPPEDECEDAMGMSPASYDDLVAAAGSPPPVHPSCQCSLAPA